MAARYWSDLTTEEFAARDLSRTVAILPVAATEQHGPHLPLSTDIDIALGYLDRVKALTPADLDVLILPVQTIGKSDEHDAFPGTLSLTTATALAAWTEIGTGVARAGCRRLVIVTSHGGNSALIDIVLQQLLDPGEAFGGKPRAVLGRFLRWGDLRLKRRSAAPQDRGDQ